MYSPSSFPFICQCVRHLSSFHVFVDYIHSCLYAISSNLLFRSPLASINNVDGEQADDFCQLLIRSLKSLRGHGRECSSGLVSRQQDSRQIFCRTCYAFFICSLNILQRKPQSDLQFFHLLSNVQCLLTALACAQASVSMVTLLSPLLSVKSPQGVP